MAIITPNELTSKVETVEETVDDIQENLLWSGTIEEFKNQTCNLYAWKGSEWNSYTDENNPINDNNWMTGNIQNVVIEGDVARFCLRNKLYTINKDLEVSSVSGGYQLFKNGNTYIMVKDNNGVPQTSTDLENWTNGTAPGIGTGSDSHWVLYKGVLIGNDTGSSAYSTDNGTTWTAGPSVSDGSIYFVENNILFCVCDNGSTVTYSTDGINWNSTSWSSQPALINRIIYDGTKYYALYGTPSQSYPIFQSTDGINWTIYYDGDEIQITWSSNCRNLSYANGKFITAGYLSDGSRGIKYSTDLIHWTDCNKIPGTASQLFLTNIWGHDVIGISYKSSGGYPRYAYAYYTDFNKILYTNTETPDVGDYVYDGFDLLLKSIKSTTNNSITISGYEYVRESTKDISNANVSLNFLDKNILCDIKDKAFVRGKEITLKNDLLSSSEISELKASGSLYKTPISSNTKFLLDSGINSFIRMDMYDVSFAKSNISCDYDWSCVAYGNGKFVAVSGYLEASTSLTNVYSYSTDGINWTSGTLPSTARWYSVAYGNGKFVALGTNSTTYGAYSTDGINWTSITTPPEACYRSICYADGKFVALGSSSKAAYSTDGITWTVVSTPAKTYWKKVAYGNGKFVAVGLYGPDSAYSTDGITWESMTLPYADTNTSWTVAYGNGKFVAVSRTNSGTSSFNSAYSTDGINWTLNILPYGATYEDICFCGDKFVACGYEVGVSQRKYIFSFDGINWELGNLNENVSIMPISICYSDDLKTIVSVGYSGTPARSVYCNLTKNYFLEQETQTIPLTDFDKTKTQTLKNVNGTIKWVTDS